MIVLFFTSLLQLFTLADKFKPIESKSFLPRFPVSVDTNNLKQVKATSQRFLLSNEQEMVFAKQMKPEWHMSLVLKLAESVDKRLNHDDV